VKKAFNQWCFPLDWSWKKVFGLAEKAKFEGIELCLDYVPFFDFLEKNPAIAAMAASVGAPTGRTKALTYESSESEFMELKGMASDHGIAIASMHTQAQMCWTLMDRDEKMWKTGVDLIKKLIDFAVTMECRTLLVLTGFVTPEIDYEYALKRLEESIWILKEDAEKKRVRLGLEDIWNKVLYSPLEMRDFIDKFESEYVGIHFDVGNVLQYGYPDQWIKIIGKGKQRIVNVHLKDYSELINNMTGFTYLFQGDVPWERVMESLKQTGYDNYLIAEVPPYPFCPEEGIWDISRKIDILLSGKY